MKPTLTKQKHNILSVLAVKPDVGLHVCRCELLCSDSILCVSVCCGCMCGIQCLVQLLSSVCTKKQFWGEDVQTSRNEKSSSEVCRSGLTVKSCLWLYVGLSGPPSWSPFQQMCNTHAAICNMRSFSLPLILTRSTN